MRIGCEIGRLQFMENKTKNYGEASTKQLDKSQVEITGSIPSEIWEKHRAQAVKNIGESVTIDGFRKGMVPENVLISKIGESAILEEMAELAIGPAYFDIIIDNKIDAVGRPSIQVTKLAKGNPLEFKAVTAVMPKVELPDYQKIAKGEIAKSSPDELKVSDKDIEDAILRVRKSRVSHEGHDHAEMSPEEHEKMIMDSLPEFNDDFVRSLGGDYKDVEDFKNKVRGIIGESKKSESQEKARIRIADAITAATKIDLPDILVESELDRTEAQFKSDVERMGVKMEDYLTHAKKTLADVRQEWRPHAEKKAKFQLILNAIAEREKLLPTREEVEEEAKHIMEHYKDADKERVRVYAETVLMNEKVFRFLEGEK